MVVETINEEEKKIQNKKFNVGGNDMIVRKG